MPIPWFDLPRNNAGTLATRLSVDAQQVQSLISTNIPVMIQSLSTLIAGIIISAVYEWRTFLVALGLIPFMIVAGVIQTAINQGMSSKTDEAYKDSSNLIMESVINIRTVKAYGYESIFSKKYD